MPGERFAANACGRQLPVVGAQAPGGEGGVPGSSGLLQKALMQTLHSGQVTAVRSDQEEPLGEMKLSPGLAVAADE